MESLLGNKSKNKNGCIQVRTKVKDKYCKYCICWLYPTSLAIQNMLTLFECIQRLQGLCIYSSFITPINCVFDVCLCIFLFYLQIAVCQIFWRNLVHSRVLGQDLRLSKLMWKIWIGDCCYSCFALCMLFYAIIFAIKTTKTRIKKGGEECMIFSTSFCEVNEIFAITTACVHTYM